MERLDFDYTRGRGAAFQALAVAAIVGALALCAHAGGQARGGQGAPRGGAPKIAAAPRGGVTLKGIQSKAKAGTAARRGPSANVGQEIRLDGTGFDDNVSVEFTAFANSTFLIRPLEAKERRVEAKVPDEVITGAVRLVDPETGASNTLTLQIVPTITRLTPETVAPGGRLLVDGAGFTNDTRVIFNGVETAVAPTIVSPVRIDIVVPPAARSGRITVVTPGGRSKPAQLKVEAAPATK